MTASSHDLRGLVIADSRSIRDAMECINSNFREVALVEDAAGRLAGLITDGDIRRGLLSGLPLDAPASAVMTRDFVAVDAKAGRAAVLDLMRARTIRHVPVIDAGRRLVGIHFLTDLIGGEAKPNAAVVMAGGRGVRLQPLTAHRPKPMVEVAGRPILERVVLHLVGHGIRRIYLSVNYLAEMIEAHFGDGSAFGCSIEYLREEAPLGTGGALALLAAPPQHPIVVMNGDQITDIDVTKLLDFHAAQRVAATVAAGPYRIEVPFGVVREEKLRVVELEEKPTVHFTVNRGIYVLEPEVLRLVPKGCDFPITDLFGKIIGDGREIAVFYSEEEWIDVGRPEDLRRANGLG
jgi:dTDP-glucose pyrophosphorylase